MSIMCLGIKRERERPNPWSYFVPFARLSSDLPPPALSVPPLPCDLFGDHFQLCKQFQLPSSSQSSGKDLQHHLESDHVEGKK